VLVFLQFKETIWKDLNDEKIAFDIKDFENSFCAKAPPQKQAASDSGKGSAPVKRTLFVLFVVTQFLSCCLFPEEIKKVELVDPKRSYNINIALARFKMTHAAIRFVLSRSSTRLLMSLRSV
jgi:hypothetical protein